MKNHLNMGLGADGPRLWALAPNAEVRKSTPYITTAKRELQVTAE